VRWLPGQGLPQALRITIGTREQMDAIADALREMAEPREVSFSRVAIIGLGLLGGSIGLAVQRISARRRTTGYDADPRRAPARANGAGHEVCETAADAVREADLVILCVPWARWAMPRAKSPLPCPGARWSAMSARASNRRQGAGRGACPATCRDPGASGGGHRTFRAGRGLCQPVPATAGASSPRPSRPILRKLTALVAFWEALGANVEVMDAAHHDLVLAVTSHLPHLIAYTIVGTADPIWKDVTQSEVIKYSAGGFRDFTRIAASDPTMWRDVFLSTGTRYWTCCSASPRT
jgi:cyclohexadieny/prephenate dehydrogenase